MAIGFGGAVFERAGVGGREEVSLVEKGFGALGQKGWRWGGVGEWWREDYRSWLGFVHETCFGQ